MEGGNPPVEYSDALMDAIKAFNVKGADKGALLAEWAKKRGLEPSDCAIILAKQTGLWTPYVRAVGLFRKYSKDVKECVQSDPVFSGKFVWFKCSLETKDGRKFQAIGCRPADSANAVMACDTAAVCRAYKRAFNFDGVVEGEL